MSILISWSLHVSGRPFGGPASPAPLAVTDLGLPVTEAGAPVVIAAAAVAPRAETA